MKTNTHMRRRRKIMLLAAASFVCLLVLACRSLYVLDAEPPAPINKKWHPGHYALVYDSRFLSMVDNQDLTGEFEAWLANLPPKVVGVQGGAYWCDLEPSKGVYDFRLIDLQLEICKKYDKRLFCTISEKQFNMPWSPAPEYIETEYDGVESMTPSFGQFARLWDPRVLERFCLLVDALGNRYDGDPFFEGIEFIETSFSGDPAIEAARGFTVNDYIGAYKTLLSRAKAAFPESVVIQEVNHLPSSGAENEITMAEFISFCAEIGVGIGGPDLFSDSQRNPQQNRIPAYDFFPVYAGVIPLASDVQFPEYACRMWYQGEETWFGNFTPQGLLDMGINTLKLNYIFWGAVEKSANTQFGFTSDVIPMLERNNWPIHTGWPSRTNR